MRNIFEVASGLALGAAALGIGLTLVAMSYHASGFILSGAGLFVLLTHLRLCEVRFLVFRTRTRCTANHLRFR